MLKSIFKLSVVAAIAAMTIVSAAQARGNGGGGSGGSGSDGGHGGSAPVAAVVPDNLAAAPVATRNPSPNRMPRLRGNGGDPICVGNFHTRQFDHCERH
jgi:hypothetical protein